jgi:hypothetical protein
MPRSRAHAPRATSTGGLSADEDELLTPGPNPPTTPRQQPSEDAAEYQVCL